MTTHLLRFAAMVAAIAVLFSCSRQPPAADTIELDEENVTPPEALAAPEAPAPSNATGCAPGARCITVTGTGRPQAGTSIVQCRGQFPDFIVPAKHDSGRRRRAVDELRPAQGRGAAVLRARVAELRLRERGGAEPDTRADGR
jgi:hypothetical protein